MASKRAQRRRACEGKHRYDSEGQARAAIAALHARKGYQGRLRAYRCPHCNGYHFGHMPRRVRQAIQARRHGS